MDDDSLAELGYTRAWLSAGLLSEEQFRAQFGEYRAEQARYQAEHSFHPHAEHWRWATIVDFLHRGPTLSDQQLLQLLQIEREDIDFGSNGTIAHELLRTRYASLPDHQFDEVCRRLLEVGHSEQVGRARIRRRFARGERTRELADLVLEAGTAEDQMAWLKDEHIDRKTVETFARAARRAPRNVARQMLKDRRFRPT